MPLSALNLFATRFGGPVLLGMVLLAFWPLSTFTYSLSAGDTLDCWLPWRFFVAATLQDGGFPAWNPYQQMGYPVHADLQGPAWYPEALIIGGTLGHGVHMLSILFLAYVIIGGLGMRHLVQQLHGLPLPALLAGAAYALSGFYVGHAMHFYAVISAAWLPWLLAALLRMLDRPTHRNSFITALFLFFLLTGGNHTFLLIAAYPLTALGSHALYRAWKNGDRPSMLRIVGASILAIGTACVLSLGTLHAVWEVGPFIERTRGLPLADAAVNPFTLRAAWSLLLPWSATADAGTLGTDTPMGNGHFGALMLAFALVGLQRPIQARERILLFMAGIAALAAMGPATPVHALLWRWLPGMDLFRFPAYFRYFVILGLVPSAAAGFAWVFQNGKGKVRLKAVLLALAAVVVILMMASEWLPQGASEEGWYGRLLAAPIGTKVILNGILALVIFAVAFWAVGRRLAAPVLSSLVLIELFLAVQVSQWSTTLGPVSPAAIQWRLDALPHGPVVPELRSMAESRDGSGVLHHLWRNTQVFRGMPSHDGYNSFWLKEHQDLQHQHPALFAAMLAQPFVYLADTVMVRTSAAVTVPASTAPALLEDGRLAASLRPSGPSDDLEVRSFDHTGATFLAQVAEPTFLVVQQNRYPGWSITVNGVAADIHAVNIAAFGTVLAPGQHQVAVRYEKPVLGWLLGISYTAFFLLLFGLVITARDRHVLHGVGVTTLLAALLWSLFGHAPKSLRVQRQWVAVENRELPDIPMVVNTDRSHSLGDGAWKSIRIDVPDRTAALDENVGEDLPGSLWLAWAGLPLTASMRAWALDRYGPPAQRVGGEDAGAWLLKGGLMVDAGTVLWQELIDQTALLHDPGAPFTRAIRLPGHVFQGPESDHLVVDLRYRASPGAVGRLVLERKEGGAMVDYEAVAMEAGVDGAWRSLYVARPIGHYQSNSEELVVYLWNAAEDTLEVKDLRVRAMNIPKAAP